MSNLSRVFVLAMLVGALLRADMHVNVSAQDATPQIMDALVDDEWQSTPAPIISIRSMDDFHDAGCGREDAFDAPLTSPNVRFQRPLVFQPLMATAASLSSTRSIGFVSVVIENLADSCGNWQFELTGEVVAPGNYPASLSLVAIDHHPLADDACDLVSVCPIPHQYLAEHEGASFTLVIGLELEIDPGTPVGVVGVRLVVEAVEIDEQQ